MDNPLKEEEAADSPSLPVTVSVLYSNHLVCFLEFNHSLTAELLQPISSVAADGDTPPQPVFADATLLVRLDTSHALSPKLTSSLVSTRMKSHLG